MAETKYITTEIGEEDGAFGWLTPLVKRRVVVLTRCRDSLKQFMDTVNAPTDTLRAETVLVVDTEFATPNEYPDMTEFDLVILFGTSTRKPIRSLIEEDFEYLPQFNRAGVFQRERGVLSLYQCEDIRTYANA